MPNLDILKHYITKDEPFGPIDSYQIGAADIDALKLLFDKQNRIYKSFRNRPSIITGRRGSGKTSYLRSVYFDNQYNSYIEIQTAGAIEHIANIIQELSGDTVFTETLWKLWEKFLWTCVLANIEQTQFPSLSKESLVIAKYLRGMNIEHDDSMDTVLWKLAESCKEVVNASSKNGLSEILRQFDEKCFEEAKAIAIVGLKSKGSRAVILMDSLEDFKLNIPSIERAIQGLLKCAGAMNNPKDVVDLRLCLPTELSGKITEISSNPIKDFNREVKLEWTAKELISIGAQRLMYFIGLYYPEFIRGKSPLDELTRDEALMLFRVVLPEKITNQNNFHETPISYILRHTQLLPRHFLMLLNSIFKRSSLTQSLNSFPVRQEKIIYGIRQVEERIVKEIFGAFRTIYPTAEEVCKRCLPQLPHVFSGGALRQVYNRHGKMVFHGDEFFNFQQMLIEIGAIGRVIHGLESDLYIKGKFKYTVGHDLPINYEDYLCLHPLFSGIYSSGKRERPIYPDGSGPDDEDYRNIDD
ncbi:MAG TPA: hypothetical protein PKC99_18360 [Anaerolineales bacterium]|nr:hypothetical protein [Anaerolineae bacterium]MBL1173055.1 hypothetical protein [Chloroflexota bacterium]MDL1926888.1 hypothetical protein [Anaerolineae bacterium AMX1]WKZ51780.1 MAG: hypothetical protein QY329_03420 [Anaerolineales bacterium]NOG76552.1 hypothetical protein [Chloroflexota bacterium]